MLWRTGRKTRGLVALLLRYSLVGLVNTAVGLLVILALQLGTGLGPYAANAGGYAAGLGVSFFLNAGWTFGRRDHAAARALRFVVAFAIAYAANLATLALLHGPLGTLSAQLAAVGVYTAVFFALCCLFVFAPAERGESVRRITAGRTSPR